MSASPEPRDPAKAETVAKVSLGAAGGADRALTDALPSMKEVIDQHAAGAGGYWIIEWLSHCKDPFVWCAVKIPAAISWAVDRFTNRQVSLIRAEAEATKTRAEAKKIEAEAKAIELKAEAEAAVTKVKGFAEAEVIEAEAEHKKQETQVLKKTRSAAELAKELRRRGIVLATDELDDEDVLRVAARKKRKKPQEEPGPEETTE